MPSYPIYFWPLIRLKVTPFITISSGGPPIVEHPIATS